MPFCIRPPGRELFDGDYPTREAAIAAAPREYDLQPGDRFETGESYSVVIPSIDGGAVLEQAEIDLDDEIGDAAEDALDCTKDQERDLGEMLTATFRAWADKHGIKVNAFGVMNIEEHEVAHGN